MVSPARIVGAMMLQIAGAEPARLAVGVGTVLYGGGGTTNKPSGLAKATQTRVKAGENRGRGGD